MSLIKLKRLHPAARMPYYATLHAAGADLFACLPDNPEGLVLEPGERVIVPTGLAMEIPVGFEVQIRPRSGVALKHGVTVLNTPGTINADYRGSVQVLLEHLGHVKFHIRDGDRIAQMVLKPVTEAKFTWANELDATQRGDGGFGSTGHLTREQIGLGVRNLTPEFRK